jgi:predicted DsbA family dithiol-disulfide isomerase
LNNGKRARITVFSDYVCPFCYLEDPDLRRVKERFGDDVKIEWRAYELRPDPIPTLDRPLFPAARETPRASMKIPPNPKIAVDKLAARG